MVKILFYINILGGGGAERVIANLSNKFAADKHEVLVVNTYRSDNEYEISEGVKRFILEEVPKRKSNRILKNVQRICKLREIIKKEKADLLISFMEEPNFRAIIASRGLKVKLIVSVRNTPVKEYPGIAGRLIAAVLMPMADGCVFQTQEAMDWFPEILQRKSKIIFNSVKDEFYHLNRAPVPGRIVALGRLSKQKNYKMMIDSFEKISSEFPDATLEIYGVGELNNLIKNYIAELGLQEQVSLKGNTSKATGVHESSDIFVMSSDFEGMPNALMEAMAAGVPSISTDCPCGGPRMLLDSKKNGILVPVNDASAMAEALRALLSDSELKESIGREARKRAEEFRPDTIYQEWKQYIDEVVNS